MRSPLPRRAALAALALSAVLAGCRASGPGSVDVHEAVLSGATQEHVVWVYGSAGTAPALSIDGTRVTLGAAVAGSVPGTLGVNGRDTYRFPAPPDTPAVRARPAPDGRVQVLGTAPGVVAVYATDGTRWTRLAGTSGTVDTRPATSLRGAGRLTDAEADALGSALLGQGPLYVAVLADDAAAAPPLTIDPTPREYLRTALSITTPEPSSTPSLRPPSTTPPTGATGGNTVTYTELASGTNATATAPAVLLAATPAQVAAVYAQAYGRQTAPPTPASVTGGTTVGIFLGQRPTGGYGVRVVRVRADGDALTVTVELRTPGPGVMTTQALTSPWTLIRVDGTYATVRVVDTAGQPLPPGSGSGGEVR